MVNSEPNLKESLRKIIKTEGELLEEPKDINLTFSFIFSYPKGRGVKTGKLVKPIFQANKPKKQKFVQVSSRVGFKKGDMEKLKTKGLDIKFKNAVKRICLMRDIDYQLEFENDKPFLQISDRLNYPITHFSFWYSLRHLYFTGLYVVVHLQGLYEGKNDIDDFSGASSLYT